ncbi:hypothetical protein H696_04932 [Fonticula alba]|uniref:MRH domain-containing protein n=1 Tax=Fonticula alba TaxID=691883 RepID=A0A058Z3D3_FONAL|nr:hypothetical protein H696_04932 [Fonticula alba]KCV68641.1 hypothetical protein H696_04932 [Fonticula alba]|eukprot:XP_009497073.1 hypothetical protein H696_04932 [Fonticula alba]
MRQPRNLPAALMLLALIAVLGLAMGAMGLPVSAADAPEPSKLCYFEDPNTKDIYDLRPLQRTSAPNYKDFSLDPNREFLYVLNLCAPVVAETFESAYGPTKCPPGGVHACQIDMLNDMEDEVYSLGTLSEVNILAPGQLDIVFTGGDMCRRSNIPRSISILAACDESADDTSPQFVGEFACTYSFIWVTKHACPIVTPKPTTPIPNPENCFIEDPEHNIRYDFTALSLPPGQHYAINLPKTITGEDSRLLLNICGNVEHPSLPDGTSNAGVIHVSGQSDPASARLHAVTGRTSPSNIVINNSGQSLSYTFANGGDCQNSDGKTVPFTTTILFTCNASLSGRLGTPVFMKHSDKCSFLLAWNSPVACGQMIEQTCNVNDGTNKVDLSALTLPSDAKTNYAPLVLAENNKPNHEYLMNVCDDLVPAQNPCREGVSICMIDKSSPGQAGLSLGNSGTLKTQDGNTVMRFSDGDACPGSSHTNPNGALRISSDVHYLCDPTAGVGIPRLMSIREEQCHYLFTWKTAAACEKAIIPPPASGGLSGGVIAIIVMLSLVSVYVIGGIVYNRFFMNKSGLEQIPHWEYLEAGYYSAKHIFTGNRAPSGSIQI